MGHELHPVLRAVTETLGKGIFIPYFGDALWVHQF